MGETQLRPRRWTRWVGPMVLAVLILGWATRGLWPSDRKDQAKVQTVVLLERSYHQLHGTYAVGHEPKVPDGYEPVRDDVTESETWSDSEGHDGFCVEVGHYRFDSDVDHAPTRAHCPDATG